MSKIYINQLWTWFHLCETSNLRMAIFTIYRGFEWITHQFQSDFTWNCWNYVNQTWRRIHMLCRSEIWFREMLKIAFVLEFFSKVTSLTHQYRVFHLISVKSKSISLCPKAFLTLCCKDQNVFEDWQFYFANCCILGTRDT